MKIWKIWQEKRTGRNIYVSAIVVADSEEQAKRTHPYEECYTYDENGNQYWKHNGGFVHDRGVWVNLDYVKAEYIGEAKEGLKPGVLLSSFKTG